ncbi:hypothetical protein AB1Y20_004046 [Prymnesium parvum]|uniref:PWWP domain-containing protein n=1 Tax=Prymnesium parvum TaxID=97485 RepID=A0AB34J8A8_PRYPA
MAQEAVDTLGAALPNEEVTATESARASARALYKRGSLVWAKIHGFPSWPSQIRSLRPLEEAQPKIRVRFWYTNDDAVLPLSKIETYASRTPIEPKKIKSKTVCKQYIAAVEIAKRILEADGAKNADGNQDAEEEVWSDDEEAAAAQDEEEGEQVPLSEWLTEGHPLCGASVARTFGKSNKVYLGRVTRWLPTAEEPLFHVEHDDGDQEDLDEEETLACKRAYERVAPAKQRAHEALIPKLIARAKREALANLPKKPKSEYSCFVDATRPAVAAAHPNASIAEVNKLLSEKWSQLDDTEHQVFEAEAIEDLRRYVGECEAKGVEVESKYLRRQRSLRGPVSALHIFKEDSEATFNIGADPELLTAEVSLLLQQGWDDLTPEEQAWPALPSAVKQVGRLTCPVRSQQEYERQAAIERTRHEAELERRRESRGRRDGREKRERGGKDKIEGTFQGDKPKPKSAKKSRVQESTTPEGGDKLSGSHA